MKKTMKTMLSLALVLTLTLSLTLPVTAARAAEPADTLAALEDLLYHYDYELTFEERAAWKNAHAAELAAFDADAYFQAQFPYYDSKEEFLELWEIDEAGFRAAMLEEYVDTQLMEEREERNIAELKTAMGGYADGVNVMINGKCVTFPDVWPEGKSGRIMVPLAAAMEHLGAEVVYDAANGAAVVSLGDRSFTHKICSDTMVTSDGETIVMDVASYVTHDRTMVPLSFFANYLGYEAYWDGAFQTAVLVDWQGLADEIGKDFTLIDRVNYTMNSGALLDQGKTVKSTLDLDMALTLMDSINGDRTVRVPLKGTALTDGITIQGDVTMDLGDAAALLTERAGTDELEPEALAELDRMVKAFSPTQMELRGDLADRVLYLRGPILALAGGEAGVDKDTWVAVPLDGIEELDTLFFGNDAQTMGERLTLETRYSMEGGYGSPFMDMCDLYLSVGEMEQMLGDGRFVKNGGTYVLTEAAWGADLTDALAEGNATVSLTVTPVGDRDCRYTMTMKVADSDMTMDFTMTGAAGKLDLDMDIHLKNTMKLAVDMAARYTATTQKPKNGPAAGDKVWDSESWTVETVGG